MATSMNGTLLEEVLLALRRLLDSDELDAVRKVEIEGHDVFVTIDEEPGERRPCRRTAREIRAALESLSRVDHAYVALGDDPELSWGAAIG